MAVIKQQIKQRDVYLLPHAFRPNTPDDHIFIVISCNDSNDHENTFIAVMVTSSAIRVDDFSFPLLDEMFIKPLAKANSHVRCHLLTLMLNDEDLKSGKGNEMKEFYFRQLMAFIGDMVFNYNFTPTTV